jgi:CheY-like chemotaxis protein
MKIQVNFMTKITSKFTGRKILVAEDYPVNQEVTQYMLELMDFSVDLAENGIEALKKFDKNSYDAILMDIQMPVMDGFETALEIRKREAGHSHIPIIALTANALTGDKEKCLAAGMDDYISKPIEAIQLETILKKYISN